MNQENKFKTPILIIAWKRPKQTKELIKKVKEINPYKLYIACDGPKNENFCRDPKIIANLAGETPAATARIVVNMLSV